MAPTPGRTIRVDETLWRAAQEAAAARGETLTDAITRYLKRYAARNRPRT